MKKRTFCNPVNINYQYQYSYNGRESADPAVVRYKDKYFLFASHGSGYWVSDDLVSCADATVKKRLAVKFNKEFLDETRELE